MVIFCAPEGDYSQNSWERLNKTLINRTKPINVNELTKLQIYKSIVKQLTKLSGDYIMY